MDGTSFREVGSLVTNARVVSEIVLEIKKKAKQIWQREDYYIQGCFCRVYPRLDQNERCPLGISCQAIQHAL